jgi:hypothetical protein
MIKPNNNVHDDDDDEPAFHVRYITDKSIENKDGYWEQYDIMKKSWFRLCDECVNKVCKSSKSLCTFHYNKENNLKKKTKNIKKKSKRLNTNLKKKPNKQKLPLETIIDDKVWN